MTKENGNIAKSYEIVISVAAFVLFGVLFTVTELFKSPFIVFGVILITLYPFRKNSVVKISITVSFVIFLLWIFNSLLGILFPFFAAFILAYIFNPVVEAMGRKNISRTIASLIIILVFAAVITLLIIFLAPPIVSQFSELISAIPGAAQGLGEWFQKVLIPKAAEWGLPTESIQEKILNVLPSRIEQILNTLLNSLSGLFAGISIILTQVVNLILIPFLTFYLLKDFNDIKALVKSLFPYSKRSAAISYYHKIDDMMGSFLRGSLVCAVIHGVGVYIFLAVLGIKYSIFLSALSALLNVIPYVGLLLSIAVTVIAALFSGDPGLQVPLVIILYLVQNLLETSYIIPKIIGDRMGIHPAVLILSLMVFSYFFGFVGMLIAMPVVSILLMLFKEWQVKRSHAEEILVEEET
jgi:predicted PurR-regulated permease PerM